MVLFVLPNLQKSPFFFLRTGAPFVCELISEGFPMELFCRLGDGVRAATELLAVTSMAG